MYLILNNSRDGGDGARGERPWTAAVLDWLMEAE